MAVGSLDAAMAGRIGLRAVVYYMTTTIMAVILGIVLVTTIKPGERSADPTTQDISSDQRNVTTADTLMDLVRNCFPPNVVQATMQSYRTNIIYPGPGEYTLENGLVVSEDDKDTWPIEGEWTDNFNILGLIVFSIVTGIAIAALGEPAKPLLMFFTSLADVILQVTRWIIWLSPVGVCFLIAGQIVIMDDIGETFASLAWYFATVMIGLIIHGFIILPALFIIFVRKLPFRYMANMTSALMTAFGTSSSPATVPVTTECVCEKNGVDRRIANFVLPIGATINMDGEFRVKFKVD